MNTSKIVDSILLKYDAEYDVKNKILTFTKSIPVDDFLLFKKNIKKLDIKEIRVERKISKYERVII